MISPILFSAYALVGVVVTIILNVARQILFRNKNEPPMVFHWLPFVGSTITYGMNPYNFFFSCREKVIAYNNCKWA